MKTRNEVEKLKREWLNDPQWDLEKTEGFEAYHDELLLFSKKCEDEWERIALEKNLKEAEKIGIEGNIKLLHYLKSLEEQISRLNDRIGELEN